MSVDSELFDEQLNRLTDLDLFSSTLFGPSVLPFSRSFKSFQNFEDEEATPSSMPFTSMIVPTSFSTFGTSTSNDNTPNSALTSNKNLAVTRFSESAGEITTIAQRPLDAIYSSSRFDLLGLLGRIANRKHPKFYVGPVDLSCAFTISDPNIPDCPIVYASPSFSTLTKYSVEEILGKNCRFLQAPDGSVVRGTPRQFCDNNSVYQLKAAIMADEECQVRILNYTKFGVPFMNLVTVFPVSLIEGGPTTYFVGLQADISTRALPGITNDGMDRIPTITYQSLSHLPSTKYDADKKLLAESADDADNDFSWCKADLDANEFLSQLTLDGIFLYVSPNCSLILSYNEDDLLGKSIYEFLHPEDVEKIACIHAGIKESKKQLQTFNRIRSKSGGYVSILTKFNTFLNPINHSPQLILCQNRAISRDVVESFESQSNPALNGLLRGPGGLLPPLEGSSPFSLPSIFNEIINSSPTQMGNQKPSKVGKVRVTQKSTEHVCASCKTTASPEWRKGPDGKKSLCNACGLRYSKMRRNNGDVAQRERSSKKQKTSGSDTVSQAIETSIQPADANRKLLKAVTNIMGLTQDTMPLAQPETRVVPKLLSEQQQALSALTQPTSNN